MLNLTGEKKPADLGLDRAGLLLRELGLLLLEARERRLDLLRGLAGLSAETLERAPNLHAFRHTCF